MVAKDYQKNKGSTKAEIGEIDTSAPFQSVKDAVSLFGEGAFSGEKPTIRKAKPQSAERVLAKEMQFHLAVKELEKLKDQLKNAETTKALAFLELERAKETVEELTQKLKVINESKESTIRATEVANHQAKQFLVASNDKSKETDGYSNIDLETARAKYMAAISELEVVKQELRKIHQEYDESVEAKDLATEQAAEAESAAKASIGRFGELSKEMESVQDSIHQVKLATTQAHESETEIFADKDAQKHLYETRLEKSVEQLLALKKDYDPELTKNLEIQLGESLSEIESLQEEMENTKSVDHDSVRTVTTELDGAKESLHKVAEEESSLKSQVERLKLELDNIKKEHSQLKEKEAETESIAVNLHVKLQKAKYELEEALMEKAKVRGDSDEMIATIHQLASESENAKLEKDEMKQQAEELKREAETARIELEEAEKQLRVSLYEAEDAKVAEARALDQIKMMSEKTDATRASTSEPGAQITISRDELESLSRKVEESEKLAVMRVAAAMAHAEAVKASENEAVKRLENMQKEIEDMKAATQEVLKKAEMAEAAKKAVDGELRRWRERERKKAAEAASRIFSETGQSFEASPRAYQYQKQKPQEKVMETRNFEKSKTSVAKKVIMPSLSSVLHKK